MEQLDLSFFDGRSLEDLHQLARARGVNVDDSARRHDVIKKILQAHADSGGMIRATGVLELMPDGFGFIRRDVNFAVGGNDDVYVSMTQIKRFDLKTGDSIVGMIRPPKDNEKYYGMLRVESVNGRDPESTRHRFSFDDLVPVYPQERLRLETGPTKDVSARMIDIVAPIGKGQRGLIVAPPKAGKTMLLKTIANSIAINHPEVLLMVLLVDERPEEVTDIRRSVKGRVVSSTFDEMPENHMRVSEMTLEMAKRLVEAGNDVVILLDSLTRMSRASNLTVNPSGRTLSGGLDPSALYRPKRFFGAARAIEKGGSLTVLATALVETGSRMDEVIFEEFKGTGNMELVLDRALSDRRIFPAIDVNRSGTRHEELLFTEFERKQVWKLRRIFQKYETIQGIEQLKNMLAHTSSNEEFLRTVEKIADDA